MEFDTYQEFTDSTAIYKEKCKTAGEQLLYCVLGLLGEAGEVAEKVKKRIRKGGISALEPDSVVTWEKNGETLTETYDEFVEALSPEFGDVIYYWSQGIQRIGQKSSDVAAANMAKLKSRKTRGVLEGSGDKR